MLWALPDTHSQPSAFPVKSVLLPVHHILDSVTLLFPTLGGMQMLHLPTFSGDQALLVTPIPSDSSSPNLAKGLCVRVHAYMLSCMPAWGAFLLGLKAKIIQVPRAQSRLISQIRRLR